MRARLVLRIALILVLGTIAFEAVRGFVLLGGAHWSAFLERREDRRERFEAARPPVAMPIRAGDLMRFPRSSFAFEWFDEAGNRLDTFRGFAAKDLLPRDSTIVLVITEAELDSVYDLVIRMRLLDPEKKFVPHPTPCQVTPRFRNTLHLVAGSFERSVEWFLPCEIYGLRSDDGKRIEEFTRLVYRILKSHPEYRALPDSSPMYL